MKPLMLSLPSAWIDLSPQQLVFISRLWLMNYSETEFLTKAMLGLTRLQLVAGKPGDKEGAHWFSHPSRKGRFIIDAETLSSMADGCKFLLTPGEVQPPRWIGAARSSHYRLYNATFEEYLMAENYYFAFTETKKPEHLDSLLACLYRRPWQRWDPARIRARSSSFSRIDPALKNVVFMWYIGFRSFVPTRCRALFSVKSTGSSTPFNPRNYINGMIHQLSNGDITIKDKLLARPCWDALDELEQRALEAELAMQYTKKQ